MHLAEIGGRAVGVVIAQQLGDAVEIKRVWVDPRARGRRAGAALIDVATADLDVPIRLTVWEWRAEAIRLYRSRGFAAVPSWDDRPGLVCMERPAPPA